MASKNWWGVGLAVAAFSLYRVWNTKESIKFLQYQVNGVKFRAPNILSPEITFSINIYNPNRAGIPVQSFFGTIRQGGNVIANFESTTPILLQGNQRQTIAIKANVKAISLILAVIRKQINLKAVQIDGMLKTGLFDMPVRTTVNVLDGIAGMHERHQIFPTEHVYRGGFLNYPKPWFVAHEPYNRMYA